MHLISDIGLLNDIIRNYFVKNTLTNNYLLSSAYYQYILKRKLFYIATSSNACILVEKVNFYQLYYYINDQNELLFFDNDAPKVLEVLYRGENQRPDEILSFW